jgi:hypothetical protein
MATPLVLAQEAPLPLTVATVMTGEQATVATTTTVAAVAGDGTRVTADEGDGDESKEHRDSKTEETLHHRPPKRPNAGSVLEAVTNGNPIRDGYRTAANRGNKKSRSPKHPGPAALPCKRCGSAKD